MNWEEIPGHFELKNQLKQNIEMGRIAHAQIFVGYEGSAALPLALAYTKEVLAKNLLAQQFDVLRHPDVYFSYPIILDKENKIEKSLDVVERWRNFQSENPFGGLQDWKEYFSDVGNKKFIIGVEEANEIIKNFSLKSHQGGYKIRVIWLPEKLNLEATNKLLKIIEEPPAKSLILLVTHQISSLLPTIISRCQQVNIAPLEFSIVQEYLETQMGIAKEKAKTISLQTGGAIGKAIAKANDQNLFGSFFVEWIRNSFMAKTNLKALQNLEAWTKKMQTLDKDNQMDFIKYCSEVFRLALHENYQIKNLTHTAIEENGFNWMAFAKYIHGTNIEQILNLLNQAHYELSRNTNSKSVFLNLSLEVTREIHRKPV